MAARSPERRQAIRGVQVEFVELPGIELISVFDRSDAALLVDAVRSGDHAGTLHRLQEGDVTESRRRLQRRCMAGAFRRRCASPEALGSPYRIGAICRLLGIEAGPSGRRSAA